MLYRIPEAFYPSSVGFVDVACASKRFVLLFIGMNVTIVCDTVHTHIRDMHSLTQSLTIQGSRSGI